MFNPEKSKLIEKFIDMKINFSESEDKAQKEKQRTLKQKMLKQKT